MSQRGEYGSGLLPSTNSQGATPPRSVDADTLGWLYYKKELYRQALPLFKESAEKLAENPVVHYHLGMAYYKVGDTTLAKGALQRALQLRKDFPGAEEAQQILTQLS